MFEIAVVVLAVICLIDWLVRTRRINPFNPVARFFRSSVDPLLAPVERPRAIFGIGLNYADHAAESGMPIPKEPILFMKATTCLCGPNDDTVQPKNSTKLDWEVEIAIVMANCL